MAPYHPSSNGLAERAVEVFKQGMRKESNGTIGDRIARFLFQYRITPHTTTGLPPCEMLMGRKLRSRLDLLKPDAQLQARVLNKQARQKSDRDKRCKPRTFTEGESVFAKNFRPGEKWLRGRILRKLCPVSFLIQLQNGQKCRRHQDQLRHRAASEQPSDKDTMVVEDIDPEIDSTDAPERDEVPTDPPEANDSGGTSRRYPSRAHRPPNRYGQ